MADSCAYPLRFVNFKDLTPFFFALKKPVLVFGEADAASDDLKPAGVMPVGVETENIVVAASKLIEDSKAYQGMVAGSSPFGDGHAAERIVKAIRSHFDLGERPKDFKPKTKPKSATDTQERSKAQGSRQKVKEIRPGASLH